jgi:hypothetical protein
LGSKIILDFGEIILDAELFDTEIAKKFEADIPYGVGLTQWGDELYGSIGVDLGEENPIPRIPAGGLAYTNNGNYLCIFFGQTPAWSVEHIGEISDGQWQKLREHPGLNFVTVKPGDSL